MQAFSALLGINMSREVHLVFQVLNYLTSDNSRKNNLLLIDKWILTILAKHNGPFGIFPNQTTLSQELNISLRYTKERIKHLQDTGLISIKRANRKNYYFLNFIENLSTDGDPQITNSYPQNTIIGEPQITSQVNHRSPHTAAVVHTNNKLNNPIKKTERAKASLTPLSLSFHPDQKMINLAGEVAIKVGLTADELIRKFKNVSLANKKKSANWNATFENFLINERPIRAMTSNKKKNKGNEIRSTVPWFNAEAYKNQ